MSYKQFLLAGFLALCTIVAASYIDESAGEKEAAGKVAAIIPVDLPTHIVPGFSFPADSNQIYKWLSNNQYDSASIYKHAWGIWAGLTARTSQMFEGENLLVYQTWESADEVQSQIKSGSGGEVPFQKTNRSLLKIPKQFMHAGLVKTTKVKIDNAKDFHVTELDKMLPPSGPHRLYDGTDVTQTLFVAVSYSPPSANYVVSESLMDTSVLNSYKVTNAIGTIPPFPTNAINLKPTYYIGHARDRYIRVPAWRGVPPSHVFPSQRPDSNWYVYADLRNEQPKDRKLVPVNGELPRTAAATCNISDFINFRLDKAMATAVNAQLATDDLDSAQLTAATAAAGDVALLVAMHVTTKEISNWTWQTYYWAFNPDKPYEPSSDMASRLRPSQITGAAAHYAVGTAYAMVLPNQPITGGTNTGVSPMFGYNPYLEGGFEGLGPDSLHLSFQDTSRLNPSFVYGVQSNCMSCHAMATSDNALGYNTDEYISMNDTMFINRVQLDFAWSIQANEILDSTYARVNKKRKIR